MTSSNWPVALTIAGSDSCGGAGIQADLKSFNRHGVYGASVLTAITAQNSGGVAAVELLPPAFIARQLALVLDDLPVGAAKTGMLPDAATVSAIAACLGESKAPASLVVDPVMVATSGDRLADEGMAAALTRELLPLSTLVTPNLEEAQALTGLAVEEHGPDAVASLLLQAGCQAVLIKGGHATGDTVSDWLYLDGERHEYRHRRLPGRFHGTGCTLSASITALLARGEPLERAVSLAIEDLQRLLKGARPGQAGGLMLLDHSQPG